ncbi:MAG TPA: uroporphyrinogen-III C-methyltransferase [Gemmatimonadaceae bacterium]|nr:uroporphyrinogen-III C-methyltransferase [Gemmatimonadaceae bacterium]
MNAPPLDPAHPESGFVSLVGAGPGDPGLITVRARALLAQADAVVYDALVNPRIVQNGAVRADAELHDVGKRGGAPSARQDAINALLVRLAREGKRVVRLKGGDPFVFGRGSEEAQALAQAGVSFEIVPGVTAGVAAPAYAGIPVTHRGVASAVTFVTGHEDPTKTESDIDWASLARAGGTLVLYMGVKRLPDIVAALTAGGLSRDTPAAVVEWGTWPRQRTVESTVAGIVQAARAAGIAAPSITIVGAVARLREEIAWFDRRPLHGRRIIVTRARAQASDLAARLTELGADVIEAPAIVIAPADPGPLRDALARLGAYQWVLFTSQNAVEIAWAALRDAGGDARRFAGVRVGAVGQATARALLDRGIAADVIPPRATAEGLAEALRQRPDVRGTRALFIKADGAGDTLPVALRAVGATVEEVVAYRTIPDASGASAARDALAANGVDAITFTSASTVRYFLHAVGSPEAIGLASVITMGPITSDAARSVGLTVHAESATATIDALVNAIMAMLPRAKR